MNHAEAQHHPIGIYLWVWFFLFVLSAFSYMVDYVGMEGLLKYFLITLFMLLKAGLIVAVFMHLMWERMAIQAAVLVPTGALIFLTGLMILEAQYTLFSRVRYFLFG